MWQICWENKRLVSKVFLACDDIILDALASLGHDEMRPSLETMAHLERFIYLLYRSKVHTQVDDLPWFYTQLVELKEKAYHPLEDH